jgi:UDPglucose 6-dehydrogenase
MGLGYVGLTTAACFASRGIRTVGYDWVREREECIRRGKLPFYEPRLDGLVSKTLRSGQLSVGSEPSILADAGVVFVTVGTPSRKDGSVDLLHVRRAAGMLGKLAKKENSFRIVVLRSTVVPGSTEDPFEREFRSAAGKSASGVAVCFNPEFLREGRAVEDTLQPRRLVIGEKKQGDAGPLVELYKMFLGRLPPLIRTTLVNAEMIKYASNAFLATKVSFINSFANICQLTPEADIEVVAKGMGLDERIGEGFLSAGLGWGGSCFPKDLRAISAWAKSHGGSLPIIDATLQVNERQPMVAVETAENVLGGLRGRRVSVLGLSFKPHTDDVRGAVSVPLVRELLRRGADVRVYDPKAMENARRVLGSSVKYAQSVAACLRLSDCCIIVTEWPGFSKLGRKAFAAMRRRVIVDGRNLLRASVPEGVEYHAVGLGPVVRRC